jgi:hypothetical protein
MKSTGQPVDRLVHEPFDGLQREDAAEFFGELLDDRGEGPAADRVELAVAGHLDPSWTVRVPAGGRGGWWATAGNAAGCLGGEAAQPGGQLKERVWAQPVVGPVAVAVGGQQAGVAQDLEVVADQRLRDVELGCEVADA